MGLKLKTFAHRIEQKHSLLRISGRVCAVSGSRIQAHGLSQFVNIGDHVLIGTESNRPLGEVLSLTKEVAELQLLDTTAAVAINAEVELVGPFAFRPSERWKGRVISALAEPIDGKGALWPGNKEYSLIGVPPSSMQRGLVGKRVHTGVRVIDAFMPLCFGQRIGIFAGSGVGKSTLLSMLAGAPGFSTVVVALVGERGREVLEFVQESLGSNLSKSVVVVATSDEPATRRKMVPLLATSIAESFRDNGEQVLLIMDSVTRYAHALRELALSSGEPPVARGYPPSVFGKLPQLMERAGPGPSGLGSITALYSVLVDGDNHNEPVADAVRGVLDGHIVLDRAIASFGRYPAIDVLASISRLADKAWSPQEKKLAAELRKLIARFEETQDLRALGGHHAGHDLELDRAVALVPRLYQSLHQPSQEGPCADAFAHIAKYTRLSKNAQNSQDQ